MFSLHNAHEKIRFSVSVRNDGMIALNFKKIKNRRNALSKCSFVKFVNRREKKLKSVSNLVWVCLKTMILRKDKKRGMN